MPGCKGWWLNQNSVSVSLFTRVFQGNQDGSPCTTLATLSEEAQKAESQVLLPDRPAPRAGLTYTLTCYRIIFTQTPSFPPSAAYSGKRQSTRHSENREIAGWVCQRECGRCERERILDLKHVHLPSLGEAVCLRAWKK